MIYADPNLSDPQNFAKVDLIAKPWKKKRINLGFLNSLQRVIFQSKYKSKRAKSLKVLSLLLLFSKDFLKNNANAQGYFVLIMFISTYFFSIFSYFFDLLEQNSKIDIIKLFRIFKEATEYFTTYFCLSVKFIKFITTFRGSAARTSRFFLDCLKGSHLIYFLTTPKHKDYDYLKGTKLIKHVKMDRNS